MRGLWRILLRVLIAGAAGALLGTTLLIWGFHRSLPRLEGTFSVGGLQAGVEVERDEAGVPTIRAKSRTDAARALGFLHAQERFFQMDLLRRAAAGELAELVGPPAFEADRFLRRHRLRARAEGVFASLPPDQRELLIAYTDGVNAGLAAAAARPPEHLLLAAKPRPWGPVDSLLCGYAMYFNLQDSTGDADYLRDRVKALGSPEVYAFLAENGSVWEAPLLGKPAPLLPVPSEEAWAPRPPAPPPTASEAMGPPPPLVAAIFSGLGQPGIGSNAWAVAGARSESGAALLASDLHLGLGAPTLWYRARILYDAPNGPVDVVGITLAGLPGVIIGSNGHLAWGFTNSYADLTDLIALRLNPDNPNQYETPDGWRDFDVHRETLRGRFGSSEDFEVRETIWGPVIDRGGQLFALQWMAHQPYALDLGLVGMAEVQTLEDALSLANRANLPTQNFVVAENVNGGRIAWTYIGPLPDRPQPASFGATPLAGTDPAARWRGRLDPARYPRVIDPPEGQIWSANNRMLGADAIRELIGNGDQEDDSRAWRIREVLRRPSQVNEGSLLSLQLDDACPFLERWRDLFLAYLDDEAINGQPQRAELRDLLASWEGRASVDSVPHRLLYEMHEEVTARLSRLVLAHLEAPADLLKDGATPRGWDQPLFQIAEQAPAFLGSAAGASVRAEVLASIDAVGQVARVQGPLSTYTWGARNEPRFAHPLTFAVPFLGSWLNYPTQPLPGDSYTVRAQGEFFGASVRLVVAPGHEERGIFQMPGGQSAHFLSPYYTAGHSKWLEGRSAPLLPGSPRWRLTLQP